MAQAVEQLWIPGEADVIASGRAYITYATGVALIHDPREELTSMVMSKSERQSGEDIVVRAEELMWQGLTKLIKYANPPESRSPLSKAKYRHSSAYPHIERVLDMVTDPNASGNSPYKKLFILDPRLVEFPPMPLEQEGLYKSIAHGRTDKVRTKALMGIFSVSDTLSPIVEGRTLSMGRREGEKRRRLTAANSVRSSQRRRGE